MELYRMLKRKPARHQQSGGAEEDWRAANPLGPERLAELAQGLREAYDSVVEQSLPERLSGFVQALERRDRATASVT